MYAERNQSETWFSYFIQKPCEDADWKSGTVAMGAALHLEQQINDQLINLHTLATKDENNQNDGIDDPQVKNNFSICYI